MVPPHNLVNFEVLFFYYESHHLLLVWLAICITLALFQTLQPTSWELSMSLPMVPAPGHSLKAALTTSKLMVLSSTIPGASPPIHTRVFLLFPHIQYWPLFLGLHLNCHTALKADLLGSYLPSSSIGGIVKRSPTHLFFGGDGGL